MTDEAPAPELVSRIEAWLATTEPQSHLERVWKLSGGISSGMTAFTTIDGRVGRSRDQIRHPGQGDTGAHTRILRQPNNWTLEHIPHAVRREFSRLGALHGEGIPVQRPVFYDETASIFGRPGLVIEYIEGQPELSTDRVATLLEPLAHQLAAIHRLDLSTPDLAPNRSIPHSFGAREKPVGDAAFQVDRIWATLMAAADLPALNEPVLLHGDYWPGNVLWLDGSLTAVLDWEESQVGDPLKDLSIARLDLWWVFGPGAMQDFTAHYLAVHPIDITHLPLWDLTNALRPVGELETWAGSYIALGRPDITAETMLAAHAGFVDQALKAIDFR